MLASAVEDGGVARQGLGYTQLLGFKVFGQYLSAKRDH